MTRWGSARPVLLDVVAGLHRARTTVTVESARLCAAGSPTDAWFVADTHIWIASALEPAGTHHRLVERR
jgi:hypothetical protein